MDPVEIYESLREKIIWLDLKPESVLNLSELAETFGVSRTPIKEVLILLQSEGWVLRHGQHFMVTPLSIDRIKEITEIRYVLELQANIWSMYRITPEELKQLNDLKRTIVQMKGSSSTRQLVELDFSFHRLMFRAAKNNQLSQILERLLNQYFRFWLSIPREIDVTSFFVETLEIIQAVEVKDESKLREATINHIKHSVDEIMGSF